LANGQTTIAYFSTPAIIFEVLLMFHKPFIHAFFALLCLSLASAPALAQTGLELMQQYQRLHEVNTEYTHSSMTLVNKKGRKRERIMQTYEKKSASGENRSLLKFLAPRKIFNVGLLTWQHSGEADDDQWLYLPASKRVKRIASAGKKNPFMGSDLSFEDMQAEDLPAHIYKVVGEEDIDGQTCWKIEALPATKKEARASAYGKRFIWLRKDITYPVKMDFFNRRDALMKQASYEDLEQIKGSVSGTVWRHNKSVMSTLKKKTSTVIVIDKRQIGLPIEENQFNQQVLKRPPVVDK
jgi:hypothetical protein